jgi:probable rRNA maturation factor
MILNRQNRVRIALPPLQKFLRQARRELHIHANEVAICLVSNPEMTRLNQTYRGKQGPTDVLSFPASQSADGASSEALLGDIAVAPLVAQRNAKRYGRTLSAELRILILHGMLHLLGYDHELDCGQMERREKILRRRLGLD